MKTINQKMMFIIISLIASSLHGQTKKIKKDLDSVQIIKSIDEMSDKVYYFPSYKIALIDKVQKKGISISAFIDEGYNGLFVKDIDVTSVNIGGCVENSEIVFLFEDGSKINFSSWNSFNCEGNSWFELKENKESLESKKLKKIKFTNGTSYDSFTMEVPQNKSTYFIQLFHAIKNNKTITIKQ